MSNIDFKKIMEGGELPEDNLYYEKVDPVLLDGTLSLCYVVAVISRPEFLQIVLRNLQNQNQYHCLRIYSPSFCEMASWKTGACQEVPDNG